MTAYKNQNIELDEAIVRLGITKRIKLEELKEQMHVTFNSVKPIRILNETLEDIKHVPEIKSNLIQIVASLAGGYLSKKIVVGKSKSTFKKILGYLLQYGVTNFISKKINPKPYNEKND